MTNLGLSFPLAHLFATLFLIMAFAVVDECDAQRAPDSQTVNDQQEIRDQLWAETQRLRREGHFDEAAAVAEQMLAVEREWLGEDAPDIISSLEWLADVVQAADRWDSAVPWREQAVAWREAHQGADHWETANARVLLAYALRVADMSAAEREDLSQERAVSQQMRTLRDQNRFAEALPLAEQSLALTIKLFGDNHRESALARTDVASIYDALGRRHEARALLEEVVAIWRSIVGERHPEYASALHNLASIHMDMGAYNLAGPLYDKALDIRLELLGEKNLDYASTLHDLACLRSYTGEFGRAEELFRKAIAIRLEVLAEEGKDAVYASYIGNLARLYDLGHAYDLAEPLFQEALQITAATLGKENAVYATRLSHLALLFDHRGNYASAEPLYLEVLAIRGRVLGKRHPDYASTLNNLAALYYDLGDYERAEPLYDEALRIEQELLGKDHPSYAESLNNVAYLYDAMGRYDQALLYRAEALASIRRNVENSAVIQDEHGQLELAREVRRFLDAYICSLLANGDGADAYGDVLNWKGATTIRQRAARLAANSEDLRPVFAELQTVVRQWIALTGAPASTDSARHAELAALAERKRRLEAKLTERSASYRASVGASPAEVRAVLPTDGALVDYLVYWKTRHVKAPQRGGLGLGLEVDEGLIKVVQVVAGGAAANDARIGVGDVILAAAQFGTEFENLEGVQLEDAVAKLTGEAGTIIRLRVRHAGTGDVPPLEDEIELTRAPIPYQPKTKLEFERSLVAFVMSPGKMSWQSISARLSRSQVPWICGVKLMADLLMRKRPASICASSFGNRWSQPLGMQKLC